MKKMLVAYFSASGNTRKLAKKIANIGQFDMVEIKPRDEYTRADLNWNDNHSRTSLERDGKIKAEMLDMQIDMGSYEKIFLAFPIWWSQAPDIINVFLKSADFSGKEIFLFATSGGSGFGSTAEKLAKLVSGADVKEGLINPKSDKAISDFIGKL